MNMLAAGPVADVCTSGCSAPVCVREPETCTAQQHMPVNTSKEDSMNKKKIVFYSMCAGLILMLGILPSCTRESGRTMITFFMGKAEVLRAGVTLKPVIKMQINDSDVIATGPDSFVLLQVAESSVIRITENSRVEMKSLLSAKNRELMVKQGKALSAVKKLGKGDAFTVKTATITASVRGTEFSVSSQPKESVVAVRKGNVEVTIIASGSGETVSEGKSFVYTDRASTRAITADEDRELEMISAIPAIPGLGEKTEKEIRDIILPLLGDSAMAAMTLEEVKAKLRRTDTVVLYDGRVITGVIISRGPVYTIMTSTGVVSVPEKKIRNTRVTPLQ